MSKKKQTESGTQGAAAFLAETFRKYVTLKTIVFLVLSSTVIIIMLATIDLASMGRSFASANPRWLAAAFLLYTLSNLCKSIRYRIMLAGCGVSLPGMFAITSYQNFFNQILPARTGELTLIYYLKKNGNSTISKGLHVLIVTRIYDLIIVAVFFLTSAVLYWGDRVNTGLLALGCAALIISIASLFFLKWIVLYGYRLFSAAAGALRISRLGIYRKIDLKLAPIAHEFTDYKTVRQIPSLIASSIVVWIVLYFFAYATIRAFNVDISFLANVVGNTGQVLANVLPVNSFGSLGTLEAGWAGGFLLVGMTTQNAFVTAFGYHAITFASAAMLAAVSWLISKQYAKRD
jgi:uncharacterized protein (TIRG00374 family)